VTIKDKAKRDIRKGNYPMHLTVQHRVDFRTSLTLIYKAEKLLVCAKGGGCLSATEFSPSFPSTLIQQPVEEVVESLDRNVPEHLFRIFSYVSTIFIK
jgi:hypothetical protein